VVNDTAKNGGGETTPTLRAADGETNAGAEIS
jgi:hypothetical protein